MGQIDRTEGLVGNTAIKAPCRVASTGNLVLTGEQTIDGVACVTGDRVLVKNQTTGAENGIYVVDTGDWSRAEDWDGAYDIVQGSIVVITQGSTYTGYGFRVTTVNPITIGTTAVTLIEALWSTSSGASFLQAGTGAVARTSQNKMRDIVDIRDFGAACDGVTDDSAAIAAALAYVNTLGGGTVRMPPGTINCGASTVVTPGGTSLKAGIHFNAAGVGYSCIKLQGAERGATILRFTDVTNAHGIDVSGAGHITLKDFQISHSGSESSGWQIIGGIGAGDSCSNIHIDDAMGSSGFVNGVKLGVVTWGLVENCRPGSTTGGGIAFQAGDAAGTDSSVVTFRQNYIGGSYGKGYYIPRCTDCSIYDPVIEYCDRGIETAGGSAGYTIVYRPHFEVTTINYYANNAAIKVIGGSLTGGTFIGTGTFSTSDTPAYAYDKCTNNWTLPNNASVVPGSATTGVWADIADAPNGVTRNSNGTYTIQEPALYEIMLTMSITTSAVASPYLASVLYGIGTYGEAYRSLSGNVEEGFSTPAILLRLPEGAVIEPRLYQNSGGGLTVAGGRTTMSIRKVG